LANKAPKDFIEVDLLMKPFFKMTASFQFPSINHEKKTAPPGWAELPY
jgi:hypothetical protein